MASGRPSIEAYFVYNEKQGSNPQISLWSAGHGFFNEPEDQPQHISPCFTVEVDFVARTLFVIIHNPILHLALADNDIIDIVNPVMDLQTLLQSYDSLRNLQDQSRYAKSQWYSCQIEIKLLASHLLLDRDIFAPFGFENLFEMGLLKPQHWHRMQSIHINHQLDDIERAVDLIDASEDVREACPNPSLSGHNTFKTVGTKHKAYSRFAPRTPTQVNGSIDEALFKFSGSALCGFDILFAPFGTTTHVAGDSTGFRCRLLGTAARLGRLEAVIALVEHGAPVDTTNIQTPLTEASYGGHLDVVHYLCQNGAMLDGNLYGRPLTAAVMHGHTEIVDYLLAAGASVACHYPPRSLEYYLTPHFWRPVTCCFRERHTEYCALEVAVRNSNSVLVRKLLDAGAGAEVDFDRYGCPGETMLAYAVRVDNVEIARLLLNAGAKSGELNLARAIKSGNTALIDMVCAGSLDIRGSPLTLALESHRFDYVLKLVEKQTKPVIGPSSPCLRHFDISTRHLSRLNSATSDAETSLIKVSLLINDITRGEDYLAYGRLLCVVEHVLSEHLMNLTSEAGRSQAAQILPYDSRHGGIHSLQVHVSNTFTECNEQDLALYQTDDLKIAQEILASHLRRLFHRLCQRVVTTINQLAFVPQRAALLSQFSNPVVQFRKAIRTIRRLTSRQLPESVEHILCSLVLADAMRATKLRSQVIIQRLSLDQFRIDIPRWRALLSAESDLLLFDKIVRDLWGGPIDGEQQSNNLGPIADNLDYLQSLLSSLTSDVHELLHNAAHGPFSDNGRRLHNIRQESARSRGLVPAFGFAFGDSRCDTNKLSSSSSHPSQDHQRSPEATLFSSSSQIVNSRSEYLAIVIMAGAIFGFVLAFLVAWRGDPLAISQVNAAFTIESADGHTSLARNCLLLTVLLDLRNAPQPQVWGGHLSDHLGDVQGVSSGYELATSTSPMGLRISGANPDQGQCDASSPYAESPSSPSLISVTTGSGTCTSTPNLSATTQFRPNKRRPVCPKEQCGMSLSSITNRNKHVRHDCPWGARISFKCRNHGCDKAYSREAYRNKHEQQACKKKVRIAA